MENYYYYTPKVLLKLKVRGNSVQTWAFMRTHKAPYAELFDTFHKQIRDPKSIEKVTSSLFLLAMVLTQVQEGHNVSVPRFDVHGESTRPFVATLSKRNKSVFFGL